MHLAMLATAVRACTRCPLSATRTQAVPGCGSERASLMVVGEAPGAREDAQGQSFLGASGALLTDLLASIGVARADVYISNVVRCRPPANRDPRPDEVAACASYLDAEIALLQPSLILLLGRHATTRVLGPGHPIGAVHGTVIERQGRRFVPLYHPAAALYNRSLRATLFADMAIVAEILRRRPQEAASRRRARLWRPLLSPGAA